jgi:calmodulin
MDDENFLNEEKINEYKESFSIFDKDNDGYISYEQLSEIIKILGHNIPDEDLQKMFREFDIDNKGSIDFKEFLGIMARKMRDTETETDFVNAFNIFDRDHNGLINGQELFDIFQSLGIEATKDDCDELIKDADLDMDGFINYEEFVRMLMNKN